MKKILFITSHLGSGSNNLFKILNNHPRIDGFRTGLCYDNIDKINILTNNIHKRENKSAIYMDELLYNTSFSCKFLCKYYKFIHVIKEALPTITEILATHPEYNLVTAANYYCFRLRGIYEYVLRTPGSVVVTGNDLENDLKIKQIEEYLNLKEPIVYKKEVKTSNTFLDNDSIIIKCQESYEKYVYALNHLI